MSYKFYYDSLLEDKSLTYTIYAKKSGVEGDVNNFVSSDENRASLNFDIDDLEEVFTDFIQEPLAISSSNGYEAGGFSLENIGENFFANLKSMSVQYEGIKEETLNTLNQLFNYGVFNNTSKFNKVLSSSDYYKAWTGADISIPLNFNSRIYSRKVGDTLQTPTDIVNKINSYFLPKAKRATNKGEYAYTVIQPPNGYNASQADQLNPRGTFCVRYGEKRMANLLLMSYDFRMSREVTDGGSSLYADVAFNFIPAGYWTEYEIKDILGATN